MSAGLTPEMREAWPRVSGRMDLVLPFVKPAIDTNFVQHYNHVMKNVTITMEDEVALWAKIEAAKRDTSLSRLLGETLKAQMESEKRIDHAEARFFSRGPRSLKDPSSGYPDRESLYER